MGARAALPKPLPPSRVSLVSHPALGTPSGSTARPLCQRCEFSQKRKIILRSEERVTGRGKNEVEGERSGLGKVWAPEHATHSVSYSTRIRKSLSHQPVQRKSLPQFPSSIISIRFVELRSNIGNIGGAPGTHIPFNGHVLLPHTSGSPKQCTATLDTQNTDSIEARFTQGGRTPPGHSLEEPGAIRWRKDRIFDRAAGSFTMSMGGSAAHRAAPFIIGILALCLVGAAQASGQGLKPSRVHFVDRVGNNALFRGNEPLGNGSSETFA